MLQHDPFDDAQLLAPGTQCGACGTIFGSRSLLIKHLRSAGNHCIDWLQQHCQPMAREDCEGLRIQDLEQERAQAHHGYHRHKALRHAVQQERLGGRGFPFVPPQAPRVQIERAIPRPKAGLDEIGDDFFWTSYASSS